MIADGLANGRSDLDTVACRKFLGSKGFGGFFDIELRERNESVKRRVPEDSLISGHHLFVASLPCEVGPISPC